MARTIKSDAQKAHEARNKALKAEAKKRRTAARKAGLKAFAEHNMQMKITASANKLARINAHIERNANAARDAAARKVERSQSDSNSKNLALVVSFASAFSGEAVSAETSFDDIGFDSFDMMTLVSANTNMAENDISDDDLETCETIGQFVQLMTATGYKVSDNELRVNAEADQANDNDVVLTGLKAAG